MEIKNYEHKKNIPITQRLAPGFLFLVMEAGPVFFNVVFLFIFQKAK